MTLHFVKLVLGSKNYKVQVSTEGCSYVADFRSAIKNKFSPLLDSYDAAQLVLCQPDGITQIEPETLATDLKEIPWKPMVVTVEELPTSAPSGSSKKQLTYKGMSTEESCEKYLDAIARDLSSIYDFHQTYMLATMGDVLFARRGNQGKPNPPFDSNGKRIPWWDYRKIDVDVEKPESLPVKPLPSYFKPAEWDLLTSLNYETTNRIHDAVVPLTSTLQPYIILPEGFYVQENIDLLKSITKSIRFGAGKELVCEEEPCSFRKL